MPAFTINQLVILGLVFLLGAVVGLILGAGGRWKARYRDEVARADALEAENKKLRADAQEMDSLRNAAARDEAARREALVRDAEVRREAVVRDEAAARRLPPEDDPTI